MMDRVDGYVTSTYMCSVCPQGRTIGTKEGRKAKQVSNEERERRMKEERQDSLVDGVPTPPALCVEGWTFVRVDRCVWKSCGVRVVSCARELYCVYLDRCVCLLCHAVETNLPCGGVRGGRGHRAHVGHRAAWFGARGHNAGPRWRPASRRDSHPASGRDSRPGGQR